MTPVEQPTPKPTTRVVLVAALLAIAVAGTFYLAVVMGLLISRFSASGRHPDDP